MRKLLILRYSQITRSDVMKTLMEFVSATRLDLAILHSLRIITQNKAPNGAIYLFNTGAIDEVQFTQLLNSAAGTDLSMKKLKECWNAICTITSETREFLDELANLQLYHKFALHIIGNTNPWHIEHITAQNLPILYTHTFSCDASTLNPEIPQANEEQWAGFEIIDLRNTNDLLNHIKQVYGEEVTPARNRCSIS